MSPWVGPEGRGFSKKTKKVKNFRVRGLGFRVSGESAWCGIAKSVRTAHAREFESLTVQGLDRSPIPP